MQNAGIYCYNGIINERSHFNGHLFFKIEE